VSSLLFQRLRFLAGSALLVVLMTPVARAQDIHFSQFTNSPLNLSPGLTGVFGGDARFVANYRSQWRSVPVPYTTYSFSAEGKLYWTRGQYDRYLTGGLLINNDEQGSIHLNSTLVGIPVSLTLPIGRSNYFTLAAMPAFGQRRFDADKMTTDAQWQSRVYDPQADRRESELFANQSLKYFDFSAGANLRIQAFGQRNRLDLGGGWHHINRPNHDFWSSPFTNPDNVRLYSKMSLYSSGLLQIQSNVDLAGHYMFQKQGSYREMVYGFGLRLHLNQNPYRELALQVGVDRRHYFDDAIVPHVEVFFRTWMLGFTYDMNRWFNAPEVVLVTNRRAGPEVSLMYRFHKPKPLPTFRSCPMM
jgi:type IX secretion system PorP/SprF family membrane protein